MMNFLDRPRLSFLTLPIPIGKCKIFDIFTICTKRSQSSLALKSLILNYDFSSYRAPCVAENRQLYRRRPQPPNPNPLGP